METKAVVKMNIEGMEKLIFTDVHFSMNVGLKTDMIENAKKQSLYMRWRRRFVQYGSRGAKLFQ